MCPRCGADPRVAREAAERASNASMAESLAIGRRRFVVARALGAIAIVPVLLGLLVLLALGLRRVYLWWLLLPALLAPRMFGVSRATAQALAVASALWTVAFGVLAWTLLEGPRVELGLVAASLSAALATNAWVLLRDPHVRAYVTHEEHRQRAQREESTSR